MKWLPMKRKYNRVKNAHLSLLQVPEDPHVNKISTLHPTEKFLFCYLPTIVRDGNRP